MDHPVAVLGPEQRVAPAEPLAGERELNLVVGPFVLFERASVPDLHRARAVFAGRNLALEVEILERVILGSHRQPVFLRDRRDPVGHCPGSERSAVLEPQIPVQPGRVVLLDDEPSAGLGRRRAVSRRLGRRLEAPLAPVGL